MKRTKTRITGAVILILGLAIALTGVFGFDRRSRGYALCRSLRQGE